MELSNETKWIICMWDIRGDSIKDTAIVLKLTLDEVRQAIAECKEDGFYDKVRRHIEYYDMTNARSGLEAFCRFFAKDRKSDKRGTKNEVKRSSDFIPKTGNKNSRKTALQSCGDKETQKSKRRIRNIKNNG